MVPQDTGTPGTSREVYSDGTRTRNPSVIKLLLIKLFSSMARVLDL